MGLYSQGEGRTFKSPQPLFQDQQLYIPSEAQQRTERVITVFGINLNSNPRVVVSYVTSQLYRVTLQNAIIKN